MTDARLPDQWLGNPQFSGVSDGAWRAFTHALMWSNRYGTDGLIESQFLNHLLVDGDLKSHVLELIDSGLVLPSQDGYQIPWVEYGQSPAETVQKQRLNNRIRKQRQKEKEGMREFTREGMREVGQDRQGQDDIF